MFCQVTSELHLPMYMLTCDIPVTHHNDRPDILKELHIMGSCDHANVLPYFGAYCRGDHVLAVLGYCVGSCTNVFQRLKRGFSETEVIAVLVQVLEGLVYLHSNRIVHRDLKCGNLLLMEDGTATIADFGVSSQLRTAESRCGAYCGHTTYHLQFELALGWRCSSVVTPCLEGHTHYLSRARAQIANGLAF